MDVSTRLQLVVFLTETFPVWEGGEFIVILMQPDPAICATPDSSSGRTEIPQVLIPLTCASTVHILCMVACIVSIASSGDDTKSSGMGKACDAHQVPSSALLGFMSF
jgi:hypothetical protein